MAPIAVRQKATEPRRRRLPVKLRCSTAAVCHLIPARWKQTGNKHSSSSERRLPGFATADGMDELQNFHEPQQQQQLDAQAVVDGDTGEDCSGSKSPAQALSMTDSARRNALREANRIHCKETRERKKRKEQLLREVGVGLTFR